MTLGETTLFSQLRAVYGTESFSPVGRSGWLITASTAEATSRVIGKLIHTKAYSKVLSKYKVLVVNIIYNIYNIYNSNYICIIICV